MQFKNFIESYFSIDDANTGALVPFTFRPIQDKYYSMLCTDYQEKDNFNGARELILKARKEGFTSFILALFCADMLYNVNPIRYLEISYRDDATRQHFRRAKTYILSYFRKKLQIDDEAKLERLVFKSINEGSEFVLAHNGASFYVGTASTRTGERGGTVQGVLFSEAAFYPDTGVLSASEVIEATKNMVAVGNGMIFLESTANGYNQFRKMWQQAKAKETDYRPRFFSWKDFYSDEDFEKIKLGFSDKRLISQEFPETPDEAFLASGGLFFETESMKWLEEKVKRAPIQEGYLATDGNFI